MKKAGLNLLSCFFTHVAELERKIKPFEGEARGSTAKEVIL
jgi:hypothetical protein